MKEMETTTKMTETAVETAAFINISNHPSTRWSNEQLQAAQEFGRVFDIPFPNVPATAGADDIRQMADELFQRLLEKKPAVVMIAGEFTLAYSVITLCLRAGIKVVAACSDRCTQEVVLPDGTTRKEVLFKFIQFREFPKL